LRKHDRTGRSLAARTAYDYIVDLLLGVDAVGGSEDYRRKVRGLEDTLSHPADSPDQECHQKDDRQTAAPYPPHTERLSLGTVKVLYLNQFKPRNGNYYDL